MNDAPQGETPPGHAPWSLKDAPSFIERQFPVGRLSAEAFKERDAKQAQTLTGLGSYWIGRKPLILVRAVVLGSLLPTTGDAAVDLDIFLKLLAMDDAAFGRRFDGGPTAFVRLFPFAAETVATNIGREWRKDIPIEELKRRAALVLSERDQSDVSDQAILKALDTFVKSTRSKKPSASAIEFADWFPRYADQLTRTIETSWQWRRDLTESDRQEKIAEAFTNLPYAERLENVRRPEECDEEDLLAPIWTVVNTHLGTRARSLPDLIEQLGIARFGRRPKVADTFCGGGSIPFEAARTGCDVYASDLNPVACMLTWGAFNIIGASEEKRTEIDLAQTEVAASVDAEITRVGIEHDAAGNRAKAFLYCLETRCPKTDWLVPMLPTLVISKTKRIVGKLVPDHSNKTYRVMLHHGASDAEMEEAQRGTIENERLVHPMNQERSGVELKTIRGDYRDPEGNFLNRLRRWEKIEFMPRPGDIFQERLYCIQWITRDTWEEGRQDTFFSEVTESDLDRERIAEQIVAENIAHWQERGIVPDMPIEPGVKTDEPIRTRGWTYWHHLFNPRQLVYLAALRQKLTDAGKPELYLNFARTLDWTTKLCRYGTGAARESISQTFDTMAIDPLMQYGVRSAGFAQNYFVAKTKNVFIPGSSIIANHPANAIHNQSDIFITDPPYADAVVYHEITEFFIAWLRKEPLAPFDQWTWNSRRNCAITGRDEEFRRDMATAYSAMTRQMTDNGLQVVMFTHQDAGVWADLGAILWAAGLCISAAWNIVTETNKPGGSGNYVQGTICLVLRKRLTDSNARRMEIEAEIEHAVAAQLARLNALDDAWHERTDAETLYTDGDLTLAAYAAALQVVTAYSSIDRQPLDRDLYRKLGKNETTMLRDLVDYAAQVANGLLVPEGFPKEMWRDLGAAERFYVRMLDMEAKGSAKVADFQNFARSFAFGGYAELMASTTANAAALAGSADLKGGKLSGEGFWGTQLRQVLFAIWKTMETDQRDPKRGVMMLKTEYAADYWQRRLKLIALAGYVALKTRRTRPEESAAADELAEALKLDKV